MLLKRIQDNVERWDDLWASYGNRYQDMSEEEMQAFNAGLHVIANDTMNELSSIRKHLARVSVSFEEKTSTPSSSRRRSR